MAQATAVLSRHKWIARFRIRVIDGNDAGLVEESRGVEFTVGTAEGNDLRLTDPSVSRHHCALVVTDEGISLRDLDSTNHTFLGGYRVEQGFVGPGARIRVGRTTFTLEAMEEEHCEALSNADGFGRLLGRTEAMRRVFALAERVARSDVSVLIEGETGTGKGLLAEAIHQRSARASGPLVVVDCGAIPTSLIESELFGHEAGAFTGADRRRIGLIESAAGGTLFLDEVGELPLEMQPKLLRALESRAVQRVGASRPMPVDFRLVSATNHDLRRSVNRGAFRSDLLFRLNTVRIEMPPLRERREDIPLLVRRLYRHFAEDPTAQPPASLVQRCMAGAWPGNVRELRSAVERAVVFDGDFGPSSTSGTSSTDAVDGDDASVFDPEVSFRAAKDLVVSSWERRYLVELLRHARGNLSRAARLARMDRGYLRERLKRYQLKAG